MSGAVTMRDVNKLVRALVEARRVAVRALANEVKARDDAAAAARSHDAAQAERCRAVTEANKAETALCAVLRQIGESGARL